MRIKGAQGTSVSLLCPLSTCFLCFLVMHWQEGLNLCIEREGEHGHASVFCLLFNISLDKKLSSSFHKTFRASEI